MTRKVTLTYELPEEVYKVLEAEAAAEGRRLDDVIVEHLARRAKPEPNVSAEEADRRRGAFREMFGIWDSGDPDSANNERIDEDLAREYGRGLDGDD